MYKVTYVHKNETEEHDLYIPADRDYCLVTAKLSVGMGISGEFTISIPDENPARHEIVCLTDEIVVYRDEREIWRGRPVTLQIDFDLNGKLTCEGILSYLYDTYYPPFEFEGSPNDLLKDVIENHNSMVEERKQFQIGEITVVDPNDYINRSSIYYNRTITILQEKFIQDSLGGYFRVRVEDGVRYLDYLEAYNTESSQPVRYGYNLLDIAQDIEYSDVASVILPLGTRLTDEDGMETDERLTVASVNNGDIYIKDDQAVETYGWIAVEAEWDDVTLPENLYTKGEDYLKQVTSPISRFTVRAIDLSLADPEIDPINLGDFVLIRVDAFGMNQMVELTGMEIDLLDPVNSVLEFGTDAATLTGATTNTQRSIQESLGSLDARFTNLTTNVLNAVYANIEEIVAGTITVDFIRAAVADLGYVTADWVEANTITVQDLEAVYADIESLYADLANIHVLFADYATIEELTAFEAYIANEYVSNAVIADLLVGYAKITDLDAVYADISELNADMATIAVLLGGVSSIGELTTIHLTTDNAIIDEAVIAEALIGTVLADIINSNIIYTDVITIMSENGGIIISGTTMQISDENGVVRMQLGQDADGGFTFVIYDETGTGIMIDSEGIHASAVPDGLIVDQMVADDANIAASKLDIEDLTRTLNENAELVLSAEQITIGGGTLDYALTEITQQIEDLESMGIESIVNYYAYGTATTYPPFEWDDDDSAVLGEGILGLMVLGVNGDSNWSTEQPPYKEGEYVWWAQKITYVDGTVVWTEPALWTDDYLRNAITIAQTELEVVQGQIQAKIWMSDIETAEDELTAVITEQYGILTVLIDTIDQRVGVMETTYGDEFTELYSLVTSLTLDLDGIVAQVTEIDEKTANALLYGVPYYAVSSSPKYYPPFEEGADESAVLGEGILGLMILGETGDFQWTTEQPIAGEGEYVWVAYLVTQLDGSTYWTEPMLLTDDWLRRQMSDMSEKYSQLVLTIDSALLEVYAAISTVEGSVTELDASIREYVDETSADILSEVAGLYVTDTEFASVTASIEQYVDQETASVLIEVSQTLIDYSKIDETVAKVETYYLVSDNGVWPDYKLLTIADSSFSNGECPDGWEEYIQSTSNSISYVEDSSLGKCARIRKGSNSVVGFHYGDLSQLSIGNKVIVELEVASSSGSSIMQYGFRGDSTNYERTTAGDIATYWTEIQGEFDFDRQYTYFVVYNNSTVSSSVSDDLFIRSVKLYAQGDAISDDDWQKDYPVISAGQYLWVRNLITYADGTQEWGEPYCVTTDAGEIDLSDYPTMSIMNATIEAYIGDSESYILSQVEGTYVTNGELTQATASIEQYVSESLSSIKLSVDGGLGGLASITMNVGDYDATAWIDLENIRQAFADDTASYVEIAAGTVAFVSNTFMCDSDYFTVEPDGTITATKGYIGGFTIGEDSLYYNVTDSPTAYDTNGCYIGADSFLYTFADNSGYIGTGSFRLFGATGTNQSILELVAGTKSTSSEYEGSIQQRIYAASTGLLHFDTTRDSDNHGEVEIDSIRFVMQSDNGSILLRADNVTSTVYLNGTELTASDENIKKDLKPIDDTAYDSANLFDSLNVETFEYADSADNKTHVGFTYQNVVSALEAAGIDPETSAMVGYVTDDDGEKLYGIEYNDIVALLVYEVQQLKKQVAELQKAS